MEDNGRRMCSRKGTGTVPKTKHRNNAAVNKSEGHQNILSNDLVSFKYDEVVSVPVCSIIYK